MSSYFTYTLYVKDQNGNGVSDVAVEWDSAGEYDNCTINAMTVNTDSNGKAYCTLWWPGG